MTGAEDGLLRDFVMAKLLADVAVNTGHGLVAGLFGPVEVAQLYLCAHVATYACTNPPPKETK